MGAVPIYFAGKAEQCFILPATCCRGHRSVDTNLTSGIINVGRSITFSEISNES